MVRDAVIPQRGHHLRRLGIARAIARARSALMAEPDRRIAERALPEPPLDPHHLLARKRVLGGRERAHRSAGPALIAQRQVRAAEPDDAPLPLEIVLEDGHQNPFRGLGPMARISSANSSSSAGSRSASEIATSITRTRSGSSARRSSVSFTLPMRVARSSLPRMK